MSLHDHRTTLTRSRDPARGADDEDLVAGAVPAEEETVTVGITAHVAHVGVGAALLGHQTFRLGGESGPVAAKP